MVPHEDRNIVRRIWEHETCRLRGHVYRPYQVIHHSETGEGMWSALVVEKGRECGRCGIKHDVALERKK